MNLSDTNTEVQTYNWDTVFAIPVKYVNKAIADKGSSPKSFTYKDSLISLTGNFGTWQICQGGDGKNMRFAFSLSSLVMTMLSTGKTTNVDSGNFVIEIILEYLPHTDPNNTNPNSKPVKLVVKSTSDDPDNPPVAKVMSSYDGSPGDIEVAMLDLGITNWCNANLAEFDHIFAVVDLNTMVDTKWQFVTPNYTSYGYVDGPTLDDSVFGVLCMTGNRTGENNDQQISPNAIPTNSVAAFLIAPQLMMNNLIAPAIANAYGLSTSDFTLSPDGSTLTLNSGITPDLPPVQDDNGNSYTPTLQSLSIQTNGQVLELISTTQTVIDDALGVVATCTATHWYNITLGSTQNGNGQALNFSYAQPPSIVHSVAQTSEGVINEIFYDITIALAAAILIILTGGAAAVAVGVVAGLLIGAIDISAALEKSLNTDTSPAVDLLIANAVAPITWPDAGDFKLNNAGLNVALQLGGDPLFT